MGDPPFLVLNWEMSRGRISYGSIASNLQAKIASSVIKFSAIELAVSFPYGQTPLLNISFYAI